MRVPVTLRYIHFIPYPVHRFDTYPKGVDTYPFGVDTYPDTYPFLLLLTPPAPDPKGVGEGGVNLSG